MARVHYVLLFTIVFLAVSMRCSPTGEDHEKDHEGGDGCAKHEGTSAPPATTKAPKPKPPVTTMKPKPTTAKAATEKPTTAAPPAEKFKATPVVVNETAIVAREGKGLDLSPKMVYVSHGNESEGHAEPEPLADHKAEHKEDHKEAPKNETMPMMKEGSPKKPEQNATATSEHSLTQSASAKLTESGKNSTGGKPSGEKSSSTQLVTVKLMSVASIVFALILS